jgi:exosortase/archaeosortase family protein
MKHTDPKLAERVASWETTRGGAFGLRPALLGVLIGFLYYDILARLAMDWWIDPNFSHGFLVPIFSAFVVWQDRKQLAALFRAILFPLAFLFFMIPIPVIVFNQIAFPLQLLAARLASSLLDLFGVPVLREGNIIQLPTMALEVAQACSGIRSLMSLGALAVIYGYFLETRNLHRVLLTLAAIPIAIVANGLRVMGTGLLGYYWDPDKAEGFFHTFSGWVIFLISLALLFSFHAVLRWAETKRTRAGRMKA